MNNQRGYADLRPSKIALLLLYLTAGYKILECVAFIIIGLLASSITLVEFGVASYFSERSSSSRIS